MNCKEFQEILPDIIDGGRKAEHEAHLHACRDCSEIVADLTVISQSAKFLRGMEDPSPRVWNSIEIALRQEGLIRQPSAPLSVVARPVRRWTPVWLVPVAAVLVVGFGLLVRNANNVQEQANETPGQVVQVALDQPLPIGGEDAQLLEAMATMAPTIRSTYEHSLVDVNAYIRDAEASAKENPDDDEAQQALMQAYEQRNMIYDMALDRGLR